VNIIKTNAQQKVTNTLNRLEKLGKIFEATAGGVDSMIMAEIKGFGGGVCWVVEVWGSQYNISWSRSTPPCFNCQGLRTINGKTLNWGYTWGCHAAQSDVTASCART
jgi:hypothetical protein